MMVRTLSPTVVTKKRFKQVPSQHMQTQWIHSLAQSPSCILAF